ncbi:MAG: hypothetical protein JWO89_459 [Verrucomicrobiaceae bacterium]|nr:hypothetical protein [Verrucomicrobiaceae bacterium]
MKRLPPARGYTLIEVLTSAVIIGIAISAAVSMSSTMVLQEELSWRTTVALNYQENSAKLWQVGLTPFEVSSLMPGTAGNPLLASVLATTGTTSELGTTDVDGIGMLEVAAHSIQTNNIGSSPNAGAATTIDVFRPTTR